jgi:hypothetical protein
MSRLIALLAVSTALFSPLQAMAAVDAAGAAAVKQMLQGYINNQTNTLKMENISLVATGDLLVEPMGTYYAVTYPHFDLLGLNEKTGEKLDLGVFKLNMQPGDKDKQWKVTMAMPSPVRYLDKTGKEALRIDLGTQKFSAVIDENYPMPLMLDFQLQSIKIGDPAQNLAVTVGEIAAKINYTEEAPGIWSGPSGFSVKNILVANKGPAAKEPGQFSIGEIKATGVVSKMDMNMVKQYQAKIAELGETGFNPDKSSPESMNALFKIISDYGIQQADSMKLQIDANNINFSQDKPEPGQVEPVKVAISNFGYGADIAGMKGDKSNGQLNLALSGWSVSPAGKTSDLEKYIPQTVNLKFGYKDLPHKALMEQLGALAQQGIALKDDKTAAQPQMMAMQAMMTVPALLGQAGTVFTINDTQISNSLYNLNLNGAFNASQQAMYGGTGSLKAVFGGMDALVTDLQAMTQNPATKPDTVQQITQALQGLAMVQMLGQQGTDATGKPARTYDFSVDATGATKLNGTDLQTLMGGAPAVAAPSPAQPPSR